MKIADMKKFLVPGICVAAVLAIGTLAYAQVRLSRSNAQLQQKIAADQKVSVPVAQAKPTITVTPTPSSSVDSIATPTPQPKKEAPKSTNTTNQAAVDPSIKIEECKTKASEDQQNFISLANQMSTEAEASNPLVIQRQLIISAMHNGPLTAAQMATLPQSVQDSLNSGDGDEINMTLTIYNQQIQQQAQQGAAYIQTQGQTAYNQSYLSCLNQ